jgi:hypothetical protein
MLGTDKIPVPVKAFQLISILVFLRKSEIQRRKFDGKYRLIIVQRNFFTGTDGLL